MGKGTKDYRRISFDPSDIGGGISINDVIMDLKQRSNTDPTSNQSEVIITTDRMSSHRITVTSHDLLGNIIAFHGTESVSSSETNSSSTSGLGSTIRTITYTPPHSIGDSTPTHTEGTPSFTGSSSSGDLGCPTTPVKGFEHHPFHPHYQKTKPLSPLLGAERSKEKPKDKEDKENYHETEMV
ncbi:hypothetical protein GQR58_012531 [Nymphon striatum]|nr:hypothetical protein GQR58_012531 [Nymphon striatum]